MAAVAGATSGCRPGEEDTQARDGRILTRVRRRLLLVLLSTLPACLSGFSEIRLVRPDAGPPDAGHFDAAQGAPDAVAHIDASDATATPPDAPDVAIVDAAPVAADALDVSGEYRVDATMPPDQVDVPLASDAGDVFDAQCPMPLCNGVCVNTDIDTSHCGRCGNSCGSGDECVGGRCGRWAFSAQGEVDWVGMRLATRRDGVEAAATACAVHAQGARHRVCRGDELTAEELRRQCNVGRSTISDPALIRAGDGGTFVPGCLDCAADAGLAAAVGGEICRTWYARIACCAFRVR